MYKQLKEIVIQYVDINSESITKDSRFIEDLGFGSYDFLAMAGDLEDEFDIEVEGHDILEIRTVGDALRYIESLSAA